MATGIVLYELLTGRRPWDATTWMEFVHALVSQPILDVRIASKWHLPAGLGEVIMRALERDPANRWRDAGSMLGALRSVDLRTFVRTRHDQTRDWTPTERQMIKRQWPSASRPNPMFEHGISFSFAKMALVQLAALRDGFDVPEYVIEAVRAVIDDGGKWRHDTGDGSVSLFARPASEESDRLVQLAGMQPEGEWMVWRRALSQR